MKKAGIEALTEGASQPDELEKVLLIVRWRSEFVNGLEAAFPSTVSTIIRTAGKLGMITSDAMSKGNEVSPCPLCGL